MKTLTFPSYENVELKIFDNRFDFYAKGWQLFSFPISSSVIMQGADDIDQEVKFEYEETSDDCIRLYYKATSSFWKEKRYILSVYKDHVTYDVHVKGDGGIPDKINYFKGGCNIPATRYFTSGCLLIQGGDIDYERAKRFVGSDLELELGLASPPPFVFPFFNDANDEIIGIGFSAKKGENTYSSATIRYQGKQAMHIELPYDKGSLKPSEWCTPTVWFGFGTDDFDIIREYSDWCRQKFEFPLPPDPKNVPLWWKKPIYCGWLEQYFLANWDGDYTKDYATQEHYEQMIARMDNAGLNPGIIIIDDKWQKDYGTMEPDTDKWPDMRAFTDACHAAGKHVLLWWRLWSPHGLSGDECIQDTGENVTVDPTSPAYINRLEKIIHKLLSDEPGCMNCDGFKLDYIYRIPPNNISGHASKEGMAGMELMHFYYETIYKLSKKAKPDALINTSVTHPYFSDVFDQIRLHDYNSSQRSTVSIMKYRTAFTRAVFPNALIDTDGANFFTGNNQHIHYHNEVSAKIGIPSLYGLMPLTDDDLRKIQEVWNEYEAGL